VAADPARRHFQADRRRATDHAAAQGRVLAARFPAFGALPRCAVHAPETFPLATQHAARAYYWLHDQDCETARAFVHRVFRALYRDGRDISDLDVVLELAARQGADRDTLLEALTGQALKDRLKGECEAALAKGVFGSPYIIVDGEPFFGADRLPQIERWLASGGF
jgi:2-hydroxychromene-2-carboxylate isomerase